MQDLNLESCIDSTPATQYHIRIKLLLHLSTLFQRKTEHIFSSSVADGLQQKIFWVHKMFSILTKFEKIGIEIQFWNLVKNNHSIYIPRYSKVYQVFLYQDLFKVLTLSEIQQFYWQKPWKQMKKAFENRGRKWSWKILWLAAVMTLIAF